MCGARRRGKRSWSICIGTRLPEGWWNIPGSGRGAVGRSMRGKRTGWSPSTRWSEEHGAARKSPTRRSDVWATHQPDGLIVRGGGSRPGHPPVAVVEIIHADGRFRWECAPFLFFKPLRICLASSLKSRVAFGDLEVRFRYSMARLNVCLSPR
jgi:hypothetical protein